MFNPEQIVEKIKQDVSLVKNTNLFICHSNLHALQALSLQNTANNICLYNETVSISFFKAHFKGKLYAFKDKNVFSKKQLYPISKVLRPRSKNINLFLGCKHNFWSTYVANQLLIEHVNILDDGLSSYGVSQELYWHKSHILKVAKKALKSLFSVVGWHYFHESNNSEIDRQCNAYYFFPNLSDQLPYVNKIQLDSKPFHHYSNLVCLSGEQKLIHVASFEESKHLLNQALNDESICYILHPRVVGKSAEVPVEILLYHSSKVSLSASSLILYLAFIGYQGEYIFQSGDAESEKILSFFLQ